MTSIPLIVDLDGTLIHTDMLHESTLKFIRVSSVNILRVPFLLTQGKAKLKQDIAEQITFDPSTLPYNDELILWLKQQRQLGRQLVLCTATDINIAKKIAIYLGIFDEVMASDGKINLAGKYKAQALNLRFGQKGFDYVGNSNADLKVWHLARNAIVVNASPSLTKATAKICNVEQQFPSKPVGLKGWVKVLRVHQWLKNILLFIPFFASHAITDSATWIALCWAFIAFSLCASSVYIANDLLDLDSDRQHVRKRNRPFASGVVPIWMGCALAPLVFSTSLLIATRVGGQFILWLLIYFIITCAYSWTLKRLVLIDCLTLAALYTLRIIAGAAATTMPLSFWLLAFSVFLFLSLAFVKRYAELQTQIENEKAKVHGRGYYTSDAPLLQTLGICSGYASVVVLSLYLTSDTVLDLYKAPEFVWCAVPIMLFWVSWIWMRAHRGQMHDDPVVFAVKDKASLMAGLFFAVALTIGALGLPW